MFNWFKKDSKSSELLAQIEDLELSVKCLKLDRDKSKEDLANLKLKKKIEEEDIKHMIALKEERLALEHEKKGVQMDKEKNEAISKIKDSFQDKQIILLKEQNSALDKFKTEILERLPNVNLKLRGEV